MAKESVISTLEILFGGNVQAALSDAAAASLLVFSLLYTPCVACLLYTSTKRVMTKAWAPGCWEVSGGAAMAGEDSKTAVLREIREETGLDLSLIHILQNGTEKTVLKFMEHIQKMNLRISRYKSIMNRLHQRFTH